MADRWTPETERVATIAILGRTAPAAARSVLTALADAGLLVAPDSKSVEEFAYPSGSRASATPGVVWWIPTWSRQVPNLHRRIVITGDWEPVAGDG